MIMTNVIMTGAALFTSFSLSISGAELSNVNQENFIPDREICKATYDNAAETLENRGKICANIPSVVCDYEYKLSDAGSRGIVLKNTCKAIDSPVDTVSGLYASAASEVEGDGILSAASTPESSVDRLSSAESAEVSNNITGNSGSTATARASVTQNTDGNSTLTGNRADARTEPVNNQGSVASATADNDSAEASSEAITSVEADNRTIETAAEQASGQTTASTPVAASGTTETEPETIASQAVEAAPKADAAQDIDNSAPATDNGSNYHHTTSIYTNDESTLLRVEYYDDNNTLFEYSSVSDYDKDTNSYTETVYQYDEENQVSVVTRTDTYVNGELVSSETP